MSLYPAPPNNIEFDPGCVARQQRLYLGNKAGELERAAAAEREQIIGYKQVPHMDEDVSYPLTLVLLLAVFS